MLENDTDGNPPHIDPIEGQEKILQKGLSVLSDQFPAKICTGCQGTGKSTGDEFYKTYCKKCDGVGIIYKSGKAGPLSWHSQVMNAGKK